MQYFDLGAVLMETDATLGVLPVRESPGEAETTLEDVAISTPGTRIPGSGDEAQQQRRRTR